MNHGQHNPRYPTHRPDRLAVLPRQMAPFAWSGLSLTGIGDGVTVSARAKGEDHA